MASETRNKGKKRKRGPQMNRRRKQSELDDDEDDENDDGLDQDDDYDLHPNPNSNRSLNACESEVLSDAGVRISNFPLVIRQDVSKTHSMVMGIVEMERAALCGESGNSHTAMLLENVSYGQLQVLSAVPADSLSLGIGDQEPDGGSSFVLRPPPIMEGKGVVKRFGDGRFLVVPMHSDWFSLNTVHRLERQVVPHYFSRKFPDHTPEKYMKYRNRIVTKYVENPEKRLLSSDCQELLVDMIMTRDDLNRIVRFLDHWGVINYSSEPVSNSESWRPESYVGEDSNGDVHVPSESLKSIDSLIKFEKPRCRLRRSENSSSITLDCDDMFDLDSKIRECFSENRCNHCCRPIFIMHYQSRKEVDVLLCPECFHEGRFVIGHSSIDFVKVDSTVNNIDIDGESWTDQETLLLLEAVEIFRDSWNDIAEYVGSKSKAQCIHHFIRLPIEDGLLDNFEAPNLSISSVMSNGNIGSFSQDSDMDNMLPFANSTNPVMALVAFLTATVGPRVAAACAHASLKVLSSADNDFDSPEHIAKIERPETNYRMNSESLKSIEGSLRGDIKTSSLPHEKVTAATRAGLAAAAMKAKNFADHEEREIQRLSAIIIDNQLKKLGLKLKQFEDLETMLRKECDQVDMMRHRFATERTRIISTQFGPTLLNSPTNPRGFAPNAAMVNLNSSILNNRPQAQSPLPPTQPSVSNYGNNPHVHPHIPFMPHQQHQFGFGPRLPLTAIQPPPPSSSSGSNAMFNAPGNSQPTHWNPMLRPS